MPGSINELTILVSIFVTALAALIILRYTMTSVSPQKKPLETGFSAKSGPGYGREVHFEFSREFMERQKLAEFTRQEPPVPWGYGDTKITAMYRDPNWIYSYWEITDDKKSELDNLYGIGAWDKSQPILRVYNITGIDFNGYNANSFEDLGIHYYANNHYIEVGAPDQTFCIDLARILPDGTFFKIARSNPVYTPRNRMSDIIDQNWPPLEELYQESYDYGDFTSR